MTMEIDYTGDAYAFPSDTTVIPAKGLTKREWMAATILSGMCANKFWNDYSWREMSSGAVCAADALIEELGK